jgi:hypothetical protein
MIEAGVVVGKNGDPLFWHLPEGRSAVSLPDSRTLWQVIWDAFEADTLLGFAHSHPGSGVPGPSYSDVTTFAAIEAALGKRLDWWITSLDHVVLLRWGGPDKISYRTTILMEDPGWLTKLRRLSRMRGAALS